MDLIRSYLKDIKSIPLLTAKEEVYLSRRIKKGDSKAKRQMITSNLRLVISIAKRYSHLGVPLLDLIEEGNIGLMKAVTKYNPNKGFRFSTYGAWWIRQHITRAIANQGKTVRIPVYMTELLSKFKRTTEELTQKLGRKPTVPELSRKIRVPIERVERMQELVTSAQTTSLETPVGTEGETEMIDLLQDEATSPEEDVTRFLQHERIGVLLKEMKERERRVIILRYGLDDSITRTLGETAKFFGITRERVRQIEVVALRKLRAMIAAQEEQQRKERAEEAAKNPKLQQSVWAAKSDSSHKSSKKNKKKTVGKRKVPAIKKRNGSTKQHKRRK